VHGPRLGAVIVSFTNTYISEFLALDITSVVEISYCDCRNMINMYKPIVTTVGLELQYDTSIFLDRRTIISIHICLLTKE